MAKKSKLANELTVEKQELGKTGNAWIITKQDTYYGATDVEHELGWGWSDDKQLSLGFADRKDAVEFARKFLGSEDFDFIAITR